MLRYFIILFFVSSFLGAETIDSKASPEKAASAAPAAVEPEKPQLDSPAKKVVFYLLDTFKRMASNRQKYLDRKQSYAEYMKKDKEIANEASTTIDYYDVCEKSLKYDYDARKKKFRKDHWAGKTNSEKRIFAGLFQDLIEEIVYPIANEFFGDLEMRHEVAEVTRGNVHIRTVVKNVKNRKKKRSNEFMVDWYLHPKADGGWIIYDIGVEEERWVPGFRSQFNDVITKKSYKELLNLMKKKLKETKEDRLDKDKKDLADAKKKADQKIDVKN